VSSMPDLSLPGRIVRPGPQVEPSGERLAQANLARRKK
jgi:hypothetical protein